MDGSGRQMSMMRTLLLLNATQRKLSFEENIHDSSSPLKALLLQHMHESLHSHLHNEQHSPHPSSLVLPPLRLYEQFESIGPSIVEEIELDEDEEREEDVQACETLLELQASIPPPRIALFDVAEHAAPALIESDISETTSATSTQPADIQTTDYASPNCRGDIAEVDVVEVDMDDMPTLSRQLSQTSIPALYHDQSLSEDEDSPASDFSAMECDEAISRFLAAHPRAESHPAEALCMKTQHEDLLSAPLAIGA